VTPTSARVATVGLGAIGVSWTVLFAAHGCRIRAYDVERAVRAGARDAAGRGLQQLEAVGEIASMSEALDRIEVVESLHEAVASAGWVQESIAEDLTAKAALFRKIAPAAPIDAILASSASEIRGGEFLSEIVGPGRAMVVHPMNPPHLIPLVEIAPTPLTSDSSLERAAGFMEQLGRAPVVLRRELSGYLVNRLQMALVGEAMRLVRDGYCSAADADTVVREGLGPRWALMGPFEAAHLNAAGGVRDYFEKFRLAIRNLMAAARPDVDYDASLLEQIHREIEVEARGRTVAELQARRDHRLLALRRHLAAEAEG
jgi:3-hydroxyacyl-CoA dehydrogenase